MRILPEETQCMIIDMQERLMPAMNGRKDCEDRALMLIRGLKLLEIPMLITQQYTKGLGDSIPEVYEAAGTKEYFDTELFWQPFRKTREGMSWSAGRKPMSVCSRPVLILKSWDTILCW